MGGPLSNVDAAWLRMEDRTNLMMVKGILVFEEPLDHRRVRSLLEKRLLPFDRFRQRVVEAPFGIGPPRWVEGDRFDLDAHLHRVALRAPGDHKRMRPSLEAPSARWAPSPPLPCPASRSGRPCR